MYAMSIARSIGARCMKAVSLPGSNRNGIAVSRAVSNLAGRFGMDSESLTARRSRVSVYRFSRLTGRSLMRRLHPVLILFALLRSLCAQFAVSDLAHLRNHESQRSSSYDRSGGNG